MHDLRKSVYASLQEMIPAFAYNIIRAHIRRHTSRPQEGNHLRERSRLSASPMLSLTKRTCAPLKQMPDFRRVETEKGVYPTDKNSVCTYVVVFPEFRVT